MVHEVRVTARLDEFLHDLHMALSRGVEERRLIVSIAVVRLAAIGQEQLDEINAAIPGHIEEARLVQRVLVARVALGLLYQVLGHVVRFHRVLDHAADEERVLGLRLLVDHVRDVLGLVEAKARLLLLQELDVTLVDDIEDVSHHFALEGN